MLTIKAMVKKDGMRVDRWLKRMVCVLTASTMLSLVLPTKER